jgi:hypothetical protein
MTAAAVRAGALWTVLSLLGVGLVPGAASLAGQQEDATPESQAAAYFVDVAEKAGLSMTVIYGGKETKKYIIETTGTGVAIFDFDNDGWQDLFFVNGTTIEGYPPGEEPTNRLYRNNHDGTFADLTDQAGLRATGWGQGVCVGDYDNDGWQDLYVTYYGKNRLYRNRGDKTFANVSEAANVAGPPTAWGAGCAFVDYDRDGFLDLMVANYVDFDLDSTPAPGEGPNCMWKGIAVMCGPRGLKPSRNILFRNLGDGTFANVTTQARIDQADGYYALSVSTLDYDQDGWTDIYVACDSTASILYHNNGDGTFTDLAILAGAAFNEDGREQAGMGSTVGDYDGDGHLDIFKTNFSDDTATLYRNNGDGTFSDLTFAAGMGLNTQFLGWGTMFFDFNNDTWPDLLLVNGHVYPEVDTHKLGTSYRQPRLLYLNNGDGTFSDISQSSGPGITASLSGRGLAAGDLWNDGRLAAVISNMYARPSLLVNQAANDNHWITLKTVGTRSNRDGIGARLRLQVGSRVLVNEVRSGSSYNSSNDLRVHFGLGAAAEVDFLEIRWPSGLIERFHELPIDSVVTLREGDGKAVDELEENLENEGQ